MQKKLIAAAVAGALVAPSAMAEVAVSGSIRTGVEYDGNDWQVADNYSRLRFKASSDLGNGQSAYMNYEFRVNSAQGSIVTGNTQRLSYVGIKGDWGSLSLGAQWSTAFNTVGTFIDKSNRYGGVGNTCIQYRMKDSVMLSTQLGGLSLMADAQMTAGGDSLDRGTIGGLFSIGGLSLGAVYQSATAADCMGVGAALNIAGIGLSGGFTDTDGGDTGFGVNASVGGLWLDYETNDSSDGVITCSYGLGLGGGAKMIVEVSNDGTDTKGIGMLRMDF
jgi:predicted porin